MRRKSWLFLLFLVGMSIVASADDIQVSCAPGLRVYLDGELMGVSSLEDHGLLLSNVAHGVHTVRVEKHGHEPRIVQVRVPIEVEVGEFAPETVSELAPDPPATPAPEAITPALGEPVAETVSEVPTGDDEQTDSSRTEQPVGSLLVTSIPQDCVVEIDGMSENKTTPHLSIGGLAAGEHSISFSRAGHERISGVVRIREGAEVAVRGNLEIGRVEFVHEGLGSLRVISKPNRCTVRFMGKIKEKFDQRLNLTMLPAGEYPMVVSIRGRTLSTNVLISNDMKTVVNVSFMKGDEPFVISYQPE